MERQLSRLAACLVLLAIACTTPAAALVNIVTNGTFEGGLSSWSLKNSGPGTHNVSAVTGGMPGEAIEILNTGSGSLDNETIARQYLNEDVTDCRHLYLSAAIKVISQTNRSSLAQPCTFDFPAVVSLSYLDVDGKPRIYRHGFYVKSTLGYVRDSTKVTPGQWFDFESPNLIDYLAFKPAYLTKVEVSALGWDYEALFDNVAVRVCSEVPEPAALISLGVLFAAALPSLRRRK